MTRRITCYVVYATLIWSAHAQDEEQVRGNMFKSNMTRNDFSKLLSSLIKLNEQRVNVLQKLYKLEDYGVLSEVLRSGDRKPENGNPNNLFLIVMSKGAIDAKTINKYQILSDDADNKPIEDAQSTERTDEMLNDLLELVDLETADPATRRNEDMLGKSSEIGGEEEDGYLEAPNDNPKIITRRGHQHGHETLEETLKSKIRRTECINANINEAEKCSTACNAAHSGVCKRRTCSRRAKKILKTECDVNCQKVFDSAVCDK